MIQVICLDRLFVEEKDAVRGVLCISVCVCWKGKENLYVDRGNVGTKVNVVQA